MRETERFPKKSAQIYSIFVGQHDKIFAMKEQVLFIRELFAVQSQFHPKAQGMKHIFVRKSSAKQMGMPDSPLFLL